MPRPKLRPEWVNFLKFSHRLTYLFTVGLIRFGYTPAMFDARVRSVFAVFVSALSVTASVVTAAQAQLRSEAGGPDSAAAIETTSRAPALQSSVNNGAPLRNASRNFAASPADSPFRWLGFREWFFLAHVHLAPGRTGSDEQKLNLRRNSARRCRRFRQYLCRSFVS